MQAIEINNLTRIFRSFIGVFLDEPTIGLDPVGARDFRIVIKNLQSEGKTILLTTHYMYDADFLCNRIGVIDHGTIVAMDSPAGLKKAVQDLSVVEIELYGAPPTVIEKIETLSGVDSATVLDLEQKQSPIVQTPRGSEAVPDI